MLRSLQFPRAFLASELSECATAFTALIILSIVAEFQIYNLGVLTSKFYLALTLRDHFYFLKLIQLSTTLIILTSLTKSLLTYASSIFTLTLRQSLTLFLTHLLCTSESLTNLSHSSIDNIDQRATQDVDQFTKDLGVLTTSLCIDPVLIIYYTWSCYQISGVLGPGMIYGYFMVSFGVCQVASSQLVTLNVLKEKQEGDLRTAHFEYTSASSGSQGHLDRMLETLMKTSASLILRESILRFVTESTALFGSLLTYLIISLSVFSRDEELSGPELAAFVSKSAFVCMYLIYRFTVVTDQIGRGARCLGCYVRIRAFYEGMRGVTDESSAFI